MNLTRKGFLGAGAALLAGASMGFVPKDKNGKPIEGFTDLHPGTLKDEPWRPFSEKKVRIGIAGEGLCSFGSAFGFQDHPNSEVVACAEVRPDRLKLLQERTKAKRAYASCEEMIEKDRELDAVYLATDAPSHARLAIMALEHGLHVVTAVPAFFGTDQLELVPKLVETVKKSGKLYMMNETSAFRADNYKMRKLYEAGYFGMITYCEGEYIHGDPPYTTKGKGHGSYNGWREGLPPQFYPTHSNGYFTCVTHKRFLDVTCRGLPSLKERYHQNRYNNPYGAEYAFLRCEDGATARMIVQWDTPSYGGEQGRIWGQKGSYDRRYGNPYRGWFEKEVKDRAQEWLKPQLPPGMPYGAHGGSHGYLTDDFLRGILVKDHKVCVDLKTALDTTIAGVYAHMSAMKDGETLKIPETVS